MLRGREKMPRGGETEIGAFGRKPLFIRAAGI